MTIPLAALAVIRATLQDATARELLNRPDIAAHRVSRALEQAGWTIAATPSRSAAHTPPQPR